MRPAEDFDVLEFRPEFKAAFGFPSSRREVVYSLEAQFKVSQHSATAAWDRIFGARWDIVVGGTYVVTRIIFRREKLKAPFSVVDKLKCKLDLMNVTPHGDYRENVYNRMCDKYRLQNQRENESETEPILFDNDSQPPMTSQMMYVGVSPKHSPADART
jgi:hypothetical protein